jgi:hypothetical protein
MDTRRWKGIARALLVCMVLVTAPSACGISAVSATDGSVHAINAFGVETAVEAAALPSGAHDIPCPVDRVRIVSSSFPRSGAPQVVVDGCGERLTYSAANVVVGGTGTMVLTSRMKTAPRIAPGS